MLTALLLSSTFVAAEQSGTSSSAILRISGKIEHPMVLRAADLQRLPHKRVTVTDDKGARVTYEGALVVDLLRSAGAPLGRRLRGAQMKSYVRVDASDGYQVIFALPEFDRDFTDRLILLADKRDGQPLLAPEGPFRIIVPAEKRHARWVREVIDLDVEQAR
ncbi:MAG: hypothetical protein JO138_04545 [Acidobacteriaceae bacterium]|nr:molybdopterin-binding protein [Acidobacteriota bacterium]MBV9498619.1 hypothetical protein [Acidobacteriaceae bacterium]